MTYDQLAEHIATSHPPEDLPYIVAALSEQVTGMQEELEAMREREQWHRRRRIATQAQQLAVMRQVTMPQLLQRIRQAGT